jgi:type I restriction enzyme R subunit
MRFRLYLASIEFILIKMRQWSWILQMKLKISKKHFNPIMIALSSKKAPILTYSMTWRQKLEYFNFFGRPDLQRFAEIYFDPKSKQEKLHSALQPALDRYVASSEEIQVEFKGTLRDYIRLYSFLSQILPFADPELEKLYVFGRFLLRRLPYSKDRLPEEIKEQIDVESYRVQKTRNGSIKLERGIGILEPQMTKDATSSQSDIEPLSAIIKELNERFGTDFADEDKVFIETLEDKLSRDATLSNSVKVNTRENARLTFNIVVNDRLQEMIDSNFKFYKKITDDEDFSKTFLDWLFDRYMKSTEAVA